MKQERCWPAILVLCLLSAVIPESVATFNTPFLAYFLAPFTIVWGVLAYGGAALLIREAMVRKGLGWTSVIVLGWSYAAINEGVVAATWFKMKPEGFQIIFGVDWVWAVALSIFHACFSMVVPICLANMLFPRIASRTWLRARGIKIAIASLILLMMLGLLINIHRPWVLLVVVVIVYVAVLAYIGVSLPAPRPRRYTDNPTPSIWRLRIMGFLGYIGFFLVMYAIPAIAWHVSHSDITQIVDILALLAFVGGVLRVLRRWTGRAGWAAQQTLALITGALGCATLVSLLAPPAWAGLQPVLTVPFLSFLFWQARRLRRGAPMVPPWPAVAEYV